MRSQTDRSGIILFWDAVGEVLTASDLAFAFGDGRFVMYSVVTWYTTVQ